jgi:putative nucleotidyltransferase with HDIG domain
MVAIDPNQLMEQARDLAPFPVSVVRLAELIVDPECNLADVADVIAYDQALTLKMLRAANSAADGSACRVTSVKEAITRLGASRVMAASVAGGARPHLQKRIPAYGLEEGALWKHSVAAAVAAEIIPRFCAVECPPEAFTAALLHDVGKTVMGRFLSPEIQRSISFARAVNHLTQMEAEVQILGVHHGELGGLIAQHWKLPPRVVQGITYHHNPEQGGDVVCDFTYLSNEIAHQIESALNGEIHDDVFLFDVAARLGVTAAQLARLRPIVAARIADVTQRYNAV